MSTAHKTNRLAETISNVLTSPNVSDSNCECANVVDVAERLAEAAWRVAKWLDPSTPMAAIETHGQAVKEAADMITLAIRDLADSIRESAKNT
jgi:hypothetical protein